MITSGVNEKTGGAIDRSDAQGRLRLLEKNAQIYRELIPQIAEAAPDAVFVVVTDPPDPLADLARRMRKVGIVLSAGTFLDSQRFRSHLAKYFDVDHRYIEAQVIGDHGTAQVFVWSSARIGGVSIAKLAGKRGVKFDDLRRRVEKEVRYANITIIEGHGASQYGIGIVAARIAETVAADERAVMPIGSFQEKFGVTLSLPSAVGRRGVIEVFEPDLSQEERAGLEKERGNAQSGLGTGFRVVWESLRIEFAPHARSGAEHRCNE